VLDAITLTGRTMRAQRQWRVVLLYFVLFCAGDGKREGGELTW
jgi:hypothetical protein